MSRESNATPHFMDTEAAAAYLGGLQKCTLERWRCRGGGPVFHKIGGRCLYSKEDLDAYLRSRRRRSTSDPGHSTATVSREV